MMCPPARPSPPRPHVQEYAGAMWSISAGRRAGNQARAPRRAQGRRRSFSRLLADRKSIPAGSAGHKAALSARPHTDKRHPRIPGSPARPALPAAAAATASRSPVPGTPSPVHRKEAETRRSSLHRGGISGTAPSSGRHAPLKDAKHEETPQREIVTTPYPPRSRGNRRRVRARRRSNRRGRRRRPAPNEGKRAGHHDPTAVHVLQHLPHVPSDLRPEQLLPQRESAGPDAVPGGPADLQTDHDTAAVHRDRRGPPRVLRHHRRLRPVRCHQPRRELRAEAGQRRGYLRRAVVVVERPQGDQRAGGRRILPPPPPPPRAHPVPPPPARRPRRRPPPTPPPP